MSACLCACVCTWVGGCEFACDRDCDYVSMCAIVFACVRAIVLSGAWWKGGRMRWRLTWCFGVLEHLTHNKMLDPVTQPHEYVDFGHVHHLCVCVVCCVVCVWECVYGTNHGIWYKHAGNWAPYMCAGTYVSVCLSVCLYVCLRCKSW
jgi:hypothetical protein